MSGSRGGDRAVALAQAASGVDCQATNLQPWGVFAQALRNSSFRLRGWPPISASIAARPVTSATSPITRTLRSVQLTLLYLVLPDCIDCSQLAFVSVTPEECVYSRSSCTIASSALKSRPIIAPKRLSSSARISFSFTATPPLHRWETNGRHRRLLRARCEWPPGRRAAKEHDEVASSELIELHSVPCQPGPDCRISNW